MSNKIPFNKPPTTIDEQIAIIKSRGIVIDDYSQAVQFLQTMNYYRFCGYALHFEYFKDRVRTHQYKKGTTFSDVIQLCDFDSELRALLFSFIEPIEILFRTTVCYEMCTRYNDSHWYLKKDLFDLSKFKHDNFLKDCQVEFNRSREIFVQAYKQKYSEPKLPAAWMLTEIISIGKWSKIYGGLKNKEDKKVIANRLQTKPWYLESWIHAVSYLRNLCAHHSRIWNRTFQIRGNITKRHEQSISNKARIAAHCTIMADMLRVTGKKDEFRNGLFSLMQKYSHIPVNKMGFAENWFEGLTWK